MEKYNILITGGLDILNVPIYIHGTNITLFGGYEMITYYPFVVIGDTVKLENVSLTATTIWLEGN